MRVAALNVVLLLASGVVIGQSTGTGNSAEPSAGNSAAPTVQTVRGCLSKTGNTYVLLGTTPVRQYRIVGGDVEALKHKLGHTVEITGAVGEKESGATTNGLYNSGSTTGVGYGTITAQSVKEVYANCS
jgi:hypothetical protein